MHAPSAHFPPLVTRPPAARRPGSPRGARFSANKGSLFPPSLPYPPPSTSPHRLHIPPSPLARACGHHPVKILSRLGCCWRTADHQAAFSWHAVSFLHTRSCHLVTPAPRLGLPASSSFGGQSRKDVGQGRRALFTGEGGQVESATNHCIHPPAPAILSNNTRN